MRVLVVGSGGREHALAWAISASPLVDRLFCAPGNAGIAEEAECIAIGATDIKALVGLCRNERIDFAVVGPEAPLVLGLVDALEAEGIAAFGPSAAAAAIEASKVFAKDLCVRAQIPTAAHRRFRDPAVAKAFIASHGAPIVVKADGLAAGKGVVVADDLDTAYRAVDAALVERRFSTAGIEIIVEDFLAGAEASFFALVGGMAAKGYPGEFQRDSEIRGLDAATSDPKVKIFHAGTRRAHERLIADGGRVLGVTALDSDIRGARDRAYAAVDSIQWPGG